VYLTWYRIHRRCYNESCFDYRSYGARGIKVHPRWHNFEAFLHDMGDPPAGASLDRIDNKGDYGPYNCRWATAEQQNNNRRSVELYEYAGEMRSLAQVSRLCGIPYFTMRKRMKLSWSIQRAANTPIHHTSAYAERRSL
jgi:hypothetical protein